MLPQAAIRHKQSDTTKKRQRKRHPPERMPFVVSVYVFVFNRFGFGLEVVVETEGQVVAREGETAFAGHACIVSSVVGALIT